MDISLPSPRPTTGLKQVAFLRELLRTPNASLAAARARVNRGSIYRWKAEDPLFAAAWERIVHSTATFTPPKQTRNESIRDSRAALPAHGS